MRVAGSVARAAHAACGALHAVRWVIARQGGERPAAAARADMWRADQWALGGPAARSWSAKRNTATSPPPGSTVRGIVDFTCVPLIVPLRTRTTLPAVLVKTKISRRPPSNTLSLVSSVPVVPSARPALPDPIRRTSPQRRPPRRQHRRKTRRSHDSSPPTAGGSASKTAPPERLPQHPRAHHASRAGCVPPAVRS